MRNILLLGAPGAGKGTQSVRVAKKFGIPHISTGDIFRQHLKEGTPLGLKAKEIIDAGRLVPDEIVIDIVRERLSQPDCKDGSVLDGFPRTVSQGEALSTFLEISAVINIDVAPQLLIDRLAGRRVCSGCGESYHSGHKGDSCTKCGGKLIIRADDREETVKERLRVYASQTQPLIEYYSGKGLLRTVDGSLDIDAVTEQILGLL